MESCIEKIKREAIISKVPIIFDDTASFLINFIQKNQPKKVLEIGTAVGYSAYVMMSAYDKIHLTTIDIDSARIKIAKNNLKIFSNRVRIINDDALKAIKKLKANQFDLIFLDGPKGQYDKYFVELVRLLKIGGSIIADNIYFHGVAIGKKPCTKGMRSMIKGLHDFVISAKLSSLKVEEFSQGDGLFVITKEEL